MAVARMAALRMITLWLVHHPLTGLWTIIWFVVVLIHGWTL